MTGGSRGGNNLGKRKSRDKGFYIRQAKNAKLGKFQLVPGMSGFLLFTNHRERDAIREGYAILNEYADKLVGNHMEGQVKSEANAEDDDDDDDDEEDIEKAVAKEKAQMEEEKGAKEKRFQKVETGAQNLLFVRTTVENPVALAVHILEDLRRGGQQKTKNLIRLVPVEATCKAFPENFSKAASEVLPKWFRDASSPPTYCVAFKSRLNNSLSKEEAVEAVNEEVRKVCEGAKVMYKEPELTVVVEVMKSHVCLAVVPKYAELKRFNTIEIVQKQKQPSNEIKAEDCHGDKNETDIDDTGAGRVMNVNADAN